MLFRVVDIETVPDLTVWTPGEAQWELRPGIEWHVNHIHANPCSLGFFEDPSPGAWRLCNLTYVKKEPFPPPQAHRVVAVSWCDVEMLPVVNKTYRLVGGRSICDWAEPAAEREMLRAFGDLQEKSPATLVTWNGRTFDLPVLAMRALHHGVSWGWYYSERDVRYRYSDVGHCDLMDFLSDFGASRQMKLGDVARLVGLPGKTDMDGSKVADVVAEGNVLENMRKVGVYCLQDVIQTAIVFVRTRFHLGIITAEGYEESLRSFEDSPLVRESGIVVEWDRLRIGG